MKKLIKSISVFVLSLSLVFSGLVFSQKAKAETSVDTWKATAIKTPKEGSLIGAGYIDVEFDNSMSGYTYEVLLDGNHINWDKDKKNIIKEELGEEVTGECGPKTFSSGTTQKTEVYTTSVAKHEITVVATKGSETHTSNPRTFYVSKKGLAMGDNMGDRVKLNELNCSWYYNWGTNAFDNSVDQDVQHIPMMWGGYDDSKEDIRNLSTTSNYILGFNEPDQLSQANMNFWEGVEVWNDYIAPLNMRKVSAAPAAPHANSDWLYRFMKGSDICLNKFLDDGSWCIYEEGIGDEESKKHIDGVEDSVDAIALHYYMWFMNPDQLYQAVDSLWDKYHKPIWITEIGLFGVKGAESDMCYDNANKRSEIQQYLEGIVDELDSRSYVERYCWFPYDVDSANAIDEFDGSGGTAMFEYSTGLYTDLGKMYSRVGNPVGYNAIDISGYPSFVWETRVRMDIDYDSDSEKVTVSWNNGTLNDVAKYSVKLDDDLYEISNGDSINTESLSNGKHVVKVTLYNSSNKVLFEKEKTFNKYKAVVTTKEETTNNTTQNETTKTKPTSKNQVPVKPSKVTLAKAKNVKKKSVKLTWNKAANAIKYKVQWALNKKFSKKVKTKITSNNSFKCTKLKKKKTYFFRVCAQNNNCVGPWSNVKKVRIKK